MANLVGKTISGRYRVDEFIGKGGMAEVYKVWDKKRTVFLAMKVLHDDLAEDLVFIRRFSCEAETLSTLQHPHIVRFYGLEQDGDLTFILMDFVDGISLRKEIYNLRNPFSLERILQIMKPICSALHYAHEMGRVHCDIKPANIMLKSNGDILVADFGIARIMEGATTMTMVGAGTPAYMAPEQVQGKKPTPQTDVYALGILLYEMVSGGERPFTGEYADIEGNTSEKVRWEQVHLKPKSPREFNVSLPVTLEQVIMKSLAKSPDKRFASVLDLLSALGSGTNEMLTANTDVPIPESKSTQQTSERKVKPADMRDRRSFPWLALGIGALMIAIGGFIGSMLWSGKSLFAKPTPTTTAIPVATATPKLVVGSTWISPIDGMTMMFVPAGEFLMGSESRENEKPIHLVYLDSYWMDQTEVTNGMYSKCVREGKCRTPTSLGSFTRQSYYGNPAYDDYPVIYVSWYDAVNYCEWAGRKLPTEAEWEKASNWDATYMIKREYPWGNNISCAYANVHIGYACADDTDIVRSYSLGESYYRLLHMADNVAEWVEDWYDAYPGSLYKDEHYGKKYRVIRGSCARCGNLSMRGFFEPDRTAGIYGFRCARSE